MKVRSSIVFLTMVVVLVGLSSFVSAEGLVGVETTLSSGVSGWSFFGELPVSDILTLEGSIAPGSSLASAYSVGARIGNQFGAYANINTISILGYSASMLGFGGFIESNASEKTSFLGKAGVLMIDYISIFTIEGKVRIDINDTFFTQIDGSYASLQGFSATAGSVGIGMKF